MAAENEALLAAAQEAAQAPDPALLERLAALERENTALAQAAEEGKALRRQAEELAAENGAPQAAAPPKKGGERRKNPLRYEDQMDQMGLVSFFERDHGGA